MQVYRELGDKELFKSANILQIADVVELSSCCSCYVFRQQFALKRVKCSAILYSSSFKQFLFNAELLDEVKTITEDLQTQDTIKRTIKLIERRQKLIKLADKSEAGWLAVDEYESDELAEDSADEKRIRKAQDKAVRKKFQMAKSASRSRSTGSSIRNVPSNSHDNLLFRGL